VTTTTKLRIANGNIEEAQEVINIHSDLFPEKRFNDTPNKKTRMSRTEVFQLSVYSVYPSLVPWFSSGCQYLNSLSHVGLKQRPGGSQAVS